MFMRKREQLLLERPSLFEIPARFFGADPLANQRRLLEGTQPVVGADDLQRLVEHGGFQGVLAVLPVQQAQLRERLDEILRIRAALLLRLRDFRRDRCQGVHVARTVRGLSCTGMRHVERGGER